MKDIPMLRENFLLPDITLMWRKKKSWDVRYDQMMLSQFVALVST